MDVQAVAPVTRMQKVRNFFTPKSNRRAREVVRSHWKLINGLDNLIDAGASVKIDASERINEAKKGLADTVHESAADTLIKKNEEHFGRIRSTMGEIGREISEKVPESDIRALQKASAYMGRASFLGGITGLISTFYFAFHLSSIMGLGHGVMQKIFDLPPHIGTGAKVIASGIIMIVSFSIGFSQRRIEKVKEYRKAAEIAKYAQEISKDKGGD